MFKNSIRNKLILFLLFATIVPFATSIVVTYFFTREKVTNETIAGNSRLIAQGETNIANYMESIMQTTLTIYSDEKLYNILNQKEIDYLDQQKEITRILLQMSHSIKNAYQVSMYLTISNRSFLVVNEYSSYMFGQSTEHAVTFLPGQDVVFEATHPIHNYGFPQSPFRPSYLSPPGVISMHRKLINSAPPQIIGTLSIDLNIDLIRSICEELYTNGEEELYILDNSGRVVYGPDPAEWGKQLTEQWTRLAAQFGTERGTFEWTKDNFSGINIYEKMKTDYVDWTIVKRIPYEHLYKSARQVTLINAFVLCLFLIIVIAATVYISIRFTAPIKALIRYITKIQSGKMDVDIDLNRSDELGILSNRFNAMMQNINNLIMQEYRLELANKNNQLRALQAQINPHFMNNALQSIGTLALQHNAPRIYALISSLAKMMRYSMNTDVSVVPFHKELEHVKSYLELQMQRFEHQLEIEYRIEEDTKHIKVPKMILQPIVENYFQHGFEPSLGVGNLIIASSITEENGQGYLQISVLDNGLGITGQRLREVVSSSSSPSDQEGIGLSNVWTRLQLYFDSSARLEIEQIMPQGVQILLTIPLKKDVMQ